jgi:hypothetical protein
MVSFLAGTNKNIWLPDYFFLDFQLQISYNLGGMAGDEERMTVLRRPKLAADGVDVDIVKVCGSELTKKWYNIICNYRRQK